MNKKITFLMGITILLTCILFKVSVYAEEPKQIIYYSYYEADQLQFANGDTYGNMLNTYIKRNLKSTSAMVKRHTIDNAITMQEPRLLEDLGKILISDPDPAIRLFTARMLNLYFLLGNSMRSFYRWEFRLKCFEDTAVPYLKLALNDTSSEVIIESAITLINYGDTNEAIQKLDNLAFTGEEKAIDSFYTLEAPAFFKDLYQVVEKKTYPLEVKKIIYNAINYPHPAVRIVASNYLAHIGDTESAYNVALQVYYEFQDTEDTQTIQAIIRALEVLFFIKSEEAINIIREATNHENTLIRNKARELLRQI